MRTRGPRAAGTSAQCFKMLGTFLRRNDTRLTQSFSSWRHRGKIFALPCVICACEHHRAETCRSDWQNIRLFSTSSTPFIPLEPDLTGAKFTFGATFLGSDGILYKRLIDTHHPPPPGAGVDGKFGLFYHRIGTKQEADVLVWHGVVEDGNSLIMGHFKVISSDLKGNAKGDQARKWLVVDTYKDTTPDSELWVVEIPPDLAEEPTSVLPDLVKSESRWITRGFSGMTVCK